MIQHEYRKRLCAGTRSCGNDGWFIQQRLGTFRCVLRCGGMRDRWVSTGCRKRLAHANIVGFTACLALKVLFPNQVYSCTLRPRVKLMISLLDDGYVLIFINHDWLILCRHIYALFNTTRLQTCVICFVHLQTCGWVCINVHKSAWHFVARWLKSDYINQRTQWLPPRGLNNSAINVTQLKQRVQAICYVPPRYFILDTTKMSRKEEGLDKMFNLRMHIWWAEYIWYG